jgi:tetratricopeptide (TPR) repeat protein
MKAARVAWFGWIGAVLLAGCGSSTPPAQAPASATSASPAAALDSPSSPEPAASPELLAGIKAFDGGRYPEARASFQAAVKKNPNDYEALYNLGMTCEKLQDKAAAEAAYKGAIAAKPDLDTAAAELSALYMDEGRTDDALAAARAGLAHHPGSGPLHENLGVALATRGDQDEAIKEFEQALQITPTEPMYHLTLAHWLNAWKLRGAVPHLDAARDLVKNDYGMTASVGFEYRMAGEFDSCIKTFDHAVTMKDGGEVRTERALCRHGLQDEKGMLDDLEAAVAKDPSYAPAHYYLAGRLAAVKRFKEAAGEYTKYLELEPNGSLAKPAAEKLKAVQEMAGKGSTPSKKKP